MRGANRFLTLAVVAWMATGAAVALELDEVVAKHIQAKGGAKWDDVETMRLTGTYTAFSVDAPFELLRKRDHRYFLDCTMNGYPVKIGYDDEAFWADNAMMGPGAKPVTTPADLQAFEREIDFATPLFDWKERGFQLALGEQTEFEGFPVIAIELTRPDETVETWYLDPQTYLELAREAPGSDFGEPAQARTFFDDFREVDGLMIPFFVESQWYTRDRTMEIDEVEINVPIDDAVFEIPAPLGMQQIVKMIDDWTVKTSVRQQPGAPWQESERTGQVVGTMRGAFLQESYTTPDGNEVAWSLSYDQYKERYRYTRITDQTNHLDILEGTFDDEGKLVLDDVQTGTSWQAFGMTFHTRVTIDEIGDQGFLVNTEISTDGGENWFLAAKQQYVRADG